MQELLEIVVVVHVEEVDLVDLVVVMVEDIAAAAVDMIGNVQFAILCHFSCVATADTLSIFKHVWLWTAACYKVRVIDRTNHMYTRKYMADNCQQLSNYLFH